MKFAAAAILMLSPSRRLSVWLIPPEPAYSHLAAVQRDLIERHQSNLPCFPPHVTLIGGVPITECVPLGETFANSSEDEAHEEAARLVLKRVERSLVMARQEGIECVFDRSKGIVSGRPANARGRVKWNQSCVAILKRNLSFVNAMKIVDEALYTSADGDRPRSAERHFRPPLGEPHYSFVYGNDPPLIPETLECPDDFVCQEVSLWWTHPPTLDGVSQWKEVGTIKLGSRHFRS